MTPQAHRDAAVQLLADVNDIADSPSEQRVLTQGAIAHALLGLLEIQIGNLRSAVGLPRDTLPSFTVGTEALCRKGGLPIAPGIPIPRAACAELCDDCKPSKGN